MWFRILLTAVALGVVLYFQLFFDFREYANQLKSAIAEQTLDN